MHNIQYDILSRLMHARYLRFSEMRAERVDSNLFQYHLKKLLDDGYVVKTDAGYTLGARGLSYADRHSSQLKAERVQPKIVVAIVLRDDKGRVLLLQKPRQPFIDTMHLPAGKIHEGEALQGAAARELLEKTGLAKVELTYRGTVHVTIRQHETIISEYFCLLQSGDFTGEPRDGTWHPTDALPPLAPAVGEVIALSASSFGYHEIEAAI